MKTAIRDRSEKDLSMEQRIYNFMREFEKQAVTTQVVMMDGRGNYEIRETLENGNTNYI